MIAPVFAVLISIFASDPSLSVNWTTASPQSINELIIANQAIGDQTINVRVQDDHLQLASCVKNGFEQRYRFMLQVCRRRNGWFSDCKRERIFTYTLRRDPLTEEYNFSFDIIGDKEEASTVALQSFEEALQALLQLRGVSLARLGLSGEIRKGRHYFLGVRLTSSCKGDYNETLAKISYILSLGLLRFQDKTTGWTYFNLW